MGKKYLLLPLLFILGLASCNKPVITMPEDNHQQQDPGNDIDPQNPENPDPENPETPVEKETFSVTIDVNAFSFSGSTTEISSPYDSKLVPTLLTYVNQEIDILENVSALGYVAIKRTQHEAATGFENKNVLWISSGSQSGKIEFIFKNRLLSAEITAQGYHKAFMCPNYLLEDGEDPYPVYSVDYDTTFQINDESWELPGYEYDEYYQAITMPTIETKTFEINSNTLTISDDFEDELGRGRIFIHKMTLTFERE